MILPLVLFTQITAACAPPQTWNLLRGIAARESGFDPNAIHVNGRSGRSYYPATAAAAVARARQLIAAGANIDAGLMGINVANWRRLGLGVASVFDPCQNVRAAADVLGMVSAYNTGSRARGFGNGYVRRVVGTALRLPIAQESHPVLAQRARAAPPQWHVFNADSTTGTAAWTVFP
jgi:type IV secretion system protein VirB1